MKNKTKKTESDNPSLVEVMIALTIGVAVVVGLPAVVGALIGGIMGAFLGGAMAVGVFFIAWAVNKKVQGDMCDSKPDDSEFPERDGVLGGETQSGWGPDLRAAPASQNRDQNPESESASGLGKLNINNIKKDPDVSSKNPFRSK